MLGNVLVLVALIVFGSLSLVSAEPLDGAATTEASAPKEAVKATNVIAEDDDEASFEDDEKISSSERNFNFEEEKEDEEEDFD